MLSELFLTRLPPFNHSRYSLSEANVFFVDKPMKPDLQLFQHGDVFFEFSMTDSQDSLFYHCFIIISKCSENKLYYWLISYDLHRRMAEFFGKYFASELDSKAISPSKNQQVWCGFVKKNIVIVLNKRNACANDNFYQNVIQCFLWKYLYGSIWLCFIWIWGNPMKMWQRNLL